MMYVSNPIAARLRSAVIQTMDRLVTDASIHMSSWKGETFDDLVKLVQSTADRRQAKASDFVLLRRHWKEGLTDPSFRFVNSWLLSDLTYLKPSTFLDRRARTQVASNQQPCTRCIVLTCLRGLARYLGLIVQRSPLIATFISDMRRSPRLAGCTPVDYAYKSSTSVERPVVQSTILGGDAVRVPVVEGLELGERFERGSSPRGKHVLPVGYHSLVQCTAFQSIVATTSFQQQGGLSGQRIYPSWLRMKQ